MGGTTTVATPPKQFDIETVETVKRKYRVTADTDEQARARLHLKFEDPAVLADGIVSEPQSEESVTKRRVSSVTAVSLTKQPATKD